MDSASRKSLRNKSKQIWNSQHYTQLKVSVDPATAAAFKQACADSGLSFASVIANFMANFASGGLKPMIIASNPPPPNLSARKLRRSRTLSIINDLQLVKDAEQLYLDNIPQNLRSSSSFDRAEQTLSDLDQAIDLLISAFD
jgi:hypothetical protein